ncbi:unnamed protein product [Dovyalis caffra]|uniref:Alpha/beta hydrolase fold-3 domain-containing protein n=1 Tax=Dovyalis caffra TaxID=77055 RepID=A0AAV1RN63_9ROSI|nr:unnamed protein product [Dovyalis caffra]
MSDQTIPTNLSSNINEYLGIFPHPDGTVTRKPSTLFPNTMAIEDLNHPTLVLSKDIPINQSNNTWARIFLPRKALERSSSTNKLPVIVFFHGGGFVAFSPATSIFHDFCTNMAMQLLAIVVSVEYRLAPEHRLPAAYDDAVEALHWIKMKEEVWLKHYADYSSCFVMGSSAGGNIAYHTCLRVAESINDLEPLKIKGLILHQPFFGGTQRTESELKLENDLALPSNVVDAAWDMSLPIGVDRDHEYSNPTVGVASTLLDHFKFMGLRMLVTGWDGDPLFDRQIGFVKLIEKKGILVEGIFGEGGYHGVEMMEPPKLSAFVEAMEKFLRPT